MLSSSHRRRRGAAAALVLMIAGCATDAEAIVGGGGAEPRYRATQTAFWIGAVPVGLPVALALLPFTCWWFGSFVPPVPLYAGLPTGVLLSLPTYALERLAEPSPEPDTDPALTAPAPSPPRTRDAEPRPDRPRPRWPAPRSRRE